MKVLLGIFSVLGLAATICCDLPCCAGAACC